MHQWLAKNAAKRFQPGKPETFTYRGSNWLGNGPLLSMPEKIELVDYDTRMIYPPLKIESVSYDYHGEDLSWMRNGSLLAAPVEIESVGYDYQMKIFVLESLL